MISSKRIRIMTKPLYHESIWKTDNTSAGSSTDHQVSLPFVATGTYDCIVEWGDGSQDYITTWNQAETTHTYTSIGTYTIKIKGKCEGFQFNNTLDKLKLLTIERWGKDFKLNAAGGHFFGCSNLTITATDTLDIGTTTDLSQSFRACTGLTTDTIKFGDTSSVTNMWAMFYSCNNFNGSLNYLSTDSCVYFSDMFGECHVFNQPLNHFDTSNIESMYAMLYNAAAFNQSLSNWNTSKVTDMRFTFQNCTAFNQDISNFNIESVTQLEFILSNATSWSTANYDKFLIEISTNQNVVNSLTFHCSSTYTLGGAAAAARADLIATDLWTINDLGGV